MLTSSGGCVEGAGDLSCLVELSCLVCERVTRLRVGDDIWELDFDGDLFNDVNLKVDESCNTHLGEVGGYMIGGEETYVDGEMDTCFV